MESPSGLQPGIATTVGMGDVTFAAADGCPVVWLLKYTAPTCQPRELVERWDVGVWFPILSPFLTATHHVNAVGPKYK